MLVNLKMPSFTLGIVRYRTSKWSAPAARDMPKYRITLYMAYIPGTSITVATTVRVTIDRPRLPTSSHPSASRVTKRPPNRMKKSATYARKPIVPLVIPDASSMRQASQTKT